jgi:hypothetical protein
VADVIHVFRLLGDFDFSGSDFAKKKLGRGTVDIFYERSSLPGSDEFTAKFRWTPGTEPSVDWNEQAVPPSQIDVKKSCIFSVSSRFTFVGAVSLKQYSADGKPECHWPLVADCDFKGKKIHSQIICEDDHQIRFDLLLPALTPQVALPANAPKVMGLSAWFKSTCEKAEIGVVFNLDFPGKYFGNSNKHELPEERKWQLFNLNIAVWVDSKNKKLTKEYCRPKVFPKTRLRELYLLGGSGEKKVPNIVDPLRVSGFNIGDLNSNANHIWTAGEYRDNYYHPTPEQYSVYLTSNGYTQRFSFRSKAENLNLGNSDIVIKNNEFHFKVKSFLNGWIATENIDRDQSNGAGARLNLHCQWGIDEASEAEWLSGAEQIKVQMNSDAELLWEAELQWDADLEKKQPRPSFQGLPVFEKAGLSDAFALLQRNPGEALFDTQGTQPQSLLPRIKAITPSKQWFCAKLSKTETTIILGKTPEPNSETKINRVGYLSLASARQLNPNSSASEKNPSVELTLSFPNWLVDSNTYKIKLSHESVDTGSKAFAAFKIDLSTANEFSARLGALQFDSTSNWLYEGTAEEKQNKEHISKLLLHTKPEYGSRDPRAGIGVEFKWELAISRVIPTTVDMPRTELDRDDRPLLIHEASNAPDSESKTKFYLVVNESLYPGLQDWRLTIRLHDATFDTMLDQTYTVISAEPFSLFRFSRLALENTGGEDSNLVAEYDSDTREWLFKRVSPYYQYVFPAQAVGESSDKPRRLELHDRNDDQQEPYPIINTKNGLARYLVDWRLTPSTELWIRPSDLARNYFLPEWAAHDIFRQRNDFGLGASLVGMRGEFLYGLAVSVDTTLEAGPSRYARVAEIEALTGLLPDDDVTSARNLNADQEIINTAMIGRWQKIRPAMKRRHERLELWVDRPDLPQRFAPAQFANGVKFALRKTALHRPPVLPPSSEYDGPVVQENTGLRYHEQGLGGGALWPLESWNAFQKLLESPKSSGGTLERVALGPTGGDADQKALFLNGIVTVVSETRGGYVQRQRVEILGRIGALWHRAKHVIVYERTVNSSAQFAPETTGASRTRRPVLRKVREYIEILEVRRNYPDFEAPLRMAGFLRGVQFNSNQIAVDSAWGNDMGDFGYQLPLWNRYSASIRPQVYPKPDVAFLSAGERDNKDDQCAQECLDPDNLFFVADLSTAEPDTNKWLTRIGIDTSDGLNANDILAILNSVPSDGDNRRPSSSRLLPGLRRFTWRLAPGSGKTRINEHRGDKPLYAGLESITFMRATGKVDSMKVEQQKKTLKSLLGINQMNTGYWKAAGEFSGNGIVSKIAQSYATLKTAVENKNKDSSIKILEAIQAQINFKEQNSELVELFNFFDTKVADAQGLKTFLGAEQLPCEELNSQVLGSLKRKRLLIEQNVRLAQRDFSAGLNAAYFKSLADANANACRKKIKENLRANLNSQLNPLFTGAYGLLDKLYSHVTVARTIVLDTEKDIETLFQRALRRLDSLAIAYRDNKPWSVERLKQFEEKLALEWNAIAGEIESAIEEAHLRLTSDISAGGSELSAAVAGVLAGEVRLKAAVFTNAKTGTLLVQQFVFSARLFMGALRSKSNETKSAIEELLKKLDIATEDKVQLENMRQVVTRFGDACNELEMHITKLEDLSSQELGEIVQHLSVVADKANYLIKTVTDNTQYFQESLEGLSGEVRSLINEKAQDLIEDANTISLRLADWMINELESIGKIVDPIIGIARTQIEEFLQELVFIKNDTFEKIEEWVGHAKSKLDGIRQQLDPIKIIPEITKTFDVVVEEILSGIPDDLIEDAINASESEGAKVTSLIQRLEKDLDHCVGRVLLPGGALDLLESNAIKLGDLAGESCELLSDSKAILYTKFERLSKQVQKEITGIATGELEKLKDLINYEKWDSALTEAKQLETSLRGAANQITEIGDNARAIGQRLIEATNNLGKGGVEAVPGNLMRLYSAATQAPELAMLEANCDRIRCVFDVVKDVIDTTKTQVYFQRLGDALKSIGLSLPFDGLSDQFRLDEEALKKLDISKFFKNFGGINLRGLLDGVKLPGGFNDAVKISHDFDRKQLRTWVQVNIDVAVPGRKELFSIGPFSLYFRNTRLIGQLRYEATAEEQDISESGYSEIVTSIEAVVSGQVMVTLQQVKLSYTRERGLDFEFDPAQIKLNEIFRFIQDALSNLFPDEIGGLTLIKDKGTPIGVEHVFALPPMSLSFGTSGVSNIQIANRFRLLAYPDFIIANRFNLSTVEQPFIFSIFILGGTGYLQVDTEYRPFDGRLMVVVEAAAGASAALAFAFGPVQGAVYITLSVALTYRKLIGQSGALSVSSVLVVAGNVSLWGMVRIFLVLVLRMTYHGNGRIDARGSLSVTVKVSRWFKLRYRTEVTYKLRDGRSTTVRTESTNIEPGENLKKLQEKAKKLQGARA